MEKDNHPILLINSENGTPSYEPYFTVEVEPVKVDENSAEQFV